MEKKKKTLLDYRNELDAIDTAILERFEERMAVCGQIAELKSEEGRPVQDREREKEKIAALCGKCADEDMKEDVAELFEQIISLSRRMQYQVMAQKGIIGAIPFEMLPTIPRKKSRVVYQGVEGAYSHAAALEYFGADANCFNVKTFDEAMKAICGGIADYAVLPIENSRAGQVGDVYDLLMHYDTYIVAETYLSVNHVLLGLPGASKEGIRRIYSHPQGLLQCSDYLEERRDVDTISVANTAVAAKKVVDDGDPAQGAIARATCAELYGLEILDDDIVDYKDNTTRFIIVSSKKVYSEDASKISVVFEASHQTGSLYRLLSHIIHNGLNMTKIESRPVPGKAWEYRFFVDFDGNLSEAGVKNALRGILQEAIYFKILGNY
ncbi:MAG: bifunctional chorismate mutase/prephenate dehydratase [Lachnospiraceae bacterium]|nr:bifunctional chorismate mutase/prephenate dehydratase [Lachnospiraceae bacterium]